MVMDANGNSHKAAGRPDGGQFDAKAGQGSDDDLDFGAIDSRVADVMPDLTEEERHRAILAILGREEAKPETMVDEDGIKRPPTPPAPPAVSPSAPGGDDNTKAYSADETCDLLSRAAKVEIGPDGVRLTDKDGRTLLDEADGRHLDYKTARRDPAMRRAVRAVYRGDLSGMPAAQRRSAMRQAWRLSGPYDRRRAIDASPNRRYIPAGSIARSLKRRRDKEGAANLLCDLFYEDAGAAGNVIRAGYPDDKHAAFVFMNRTKIQRYDKDVFSKTEKDKDGNPKLLHAKGTAIVGDYVAARTGRQVHGPLPNPKGAAARSYLSMIWKPTNGVPSEQDVRDVCDVLRACDDDPETQARMMWDMCYGTGSVTNPDGDVDFAKRILGGRKAHRRGVGLLNRFSAGKGQGNAARMVAYKKPMTTEAARIFLEMEPGDGRRANTGYTRRKRGKDGQMHDVKPARLTEMRNFIHSVYEI